jgi:hypothetical protein
MSGDELDVRDEDRDDGTAVELLSDVGDIGVAVFAAAGS